MEFNLNISEILFLTIIGIYDMNMLKRQRDGGCLSLHGTKGFFSVSCATLRSAFARKIVFKVHHRANYQTMDQTVRIDGLCPRSKTRAITTYC